MWNYRIVINEFFFNDSTMYVAGLHEVYYSDVTGLPNGLTENPTLSSAECYSIEEAVKELKETMDLLYRAFDKDCLSPIEGYMKATIYKEDEKLITVFDRDDAYFDEMYLNDEEDEDEYE